MQSYRLPPALRPGDCVAILSPATTVKREYVEGAARWLERHGLVPRLMEGVLGPEDGTFASSLETRQRAINEAIADPEVRAILCARGGYGCVHLLPDLDMEGIARDPKWVIGFSDVSALHAAWHRAGVASLHAGMAKHLTLMPEDDPTIALFRDIIFGADKCLSVSVPTSEFSTAGEGRGTLVGGNFAVLDALVGTDFDLLTPRTDEDVVILLEDIAEPIYKIERMLYRLLLAGVLGRAKALIFGAFTEYRPDANHPSMEVMVRRFLDRHGLQLPVAMEFPVGHVDRNFPMILGARVSLDVTPETTTLTYL